MNESIRAREVRAVFPDGTTEIMPTSAALRKAQELGLDLVLVAPTAVPPVAKAVDFGHYQYEQKKKQHDAKKKQHVVQVKELKFRPNTDDHDYDFKKNHAIRFLAEGNRVKAVVQFRGREIAHTDLGKKLLMRFRRRPVGARQRGRPAAPGRPQRAHPDQPGEGHRGSQTGSGREAGVIDARLISFPNARPGSGAESAGGALKGNRNDEFPVGPVGAPQAQGLCAPARPYPLYRRDPPKTGLLGAAC